MTHEEQGRAGAWEIEDGRRENENRLDARGAGEKPGARGEMSGPGSGEEAEEEKRVKLKCKCKCAQLRRW